MDINSPDNISENRSKPEKWKAVYADPDKLVEFTFENKADHKKYIWVEPGALLIELNAGTEYKIVTHEKSFHIEYTSENQFTLWMNNTFGFKLYKSLSKSDGEIDWVLDIDI